MAIFQKFDQPTNLSTGGITCPTGHCFGTHGGLTDGILFDEFTRWISGFLEIQKLEITEFLLVKYKMTSRSSESQHPICVTFYTTLKWIVGGNHGFFVRPTPKNCGVLDSESDWNLLLYLTLIGKYHILSFYIRFSSIHPPGWFVRLLLYSMCSYQKPPNHMSITSGFVVWVIVYCVPW